MASTGRKPSNENTAKIRSPIIRPAYKRAHSTSPPKVKAKVPYMPTRSSENVKCSQSSVSAPEPNKTQLPVEKKKTVSEDKIHQHNDKGVVLPTCVKQKMQKTLAMKKLTFKKLKKTLFSSQTVFLELYSSIKDLENRIGVQNDPTFGDIRIISMAGWPSHDLLMLVHEGESVPHEDADVNGVFGASILQQMQDELSNLPDVFFHLSSELLAKRIEVINILKTKLKPDRAMFSYTQSSEWKAKLAELEKDTEKLNGQAAMAAEEMVLKIKRAAELAKKPWYDRESLIRKNEKLENENAILQCKIEEVTAKSAIGEDVKLPIRPDSRAQSVCSDLNKERNTKDNLKDVLRTAEGSDLNKERNAKDNLRDVLRTAEEMLRASRAKIASLERQHKELRIELESSKKKAKDLEQLIRFKETNHDSRTKKLMEVSKTGEMTIMVLTRQREALELRVKELQDQLEEANKSGLEKINEQRSRADSLQAKVIEQEKGREVAESKVIELESKIRQTEEKLEKVREKSLNLVQISKDRCLDYTPTKESEPSDRETELWKELEGTKFLLKQAEDELMRSRQDKDSFLNSLSRLAQEADGKLKDKMTTELLEREQKIAKMQQVLDELQESEKMMAAKIMNYEDQIVDLKMEVRRLRFYDCFSNDAPYDDLQIELLDLHQKVQSLTKERSALISAAAARALMLECHERSADLYGRITRWRRELETVLSENEGEMATNDAMGKTEMTRSLSSITASAAKTWTALKAERARVLNLEQKVLNQSLHVERSEQIRTQLERKCNYYERQVLQTQMALKTSCQTNGVKL